MPRKRDIITEILKWFAEEHLAAVNVVFAIVKQTVVGRQPVAEKKMRRKRQSKPVVAEPAFSQAHGLPALRLPEPSETSAVSLSKSRRSKRMRADSPPPTNEARPIVPLRDTVGEDEPESYTGN